MSRMLAARLTTLGRCRSRSRADALVYARVGAIYLETQTTRAPGIRPAAALACPVVLFQAVPLLSQ